MTKYTEKIDRRLWDTLLEFLMHYPFLKLPTLLLFLKYLYFLKISEFAIIENGLN